MTEQQFQAARKIMQSANFIRGLITKAEGEVARWTAIESGHRNNLREGQANGAKKLINKSIDKLAKVRQRFKDLKLPDENAQSATKWVVALDNDSYNYLPKEIPETKFEEAGKEGLKLYNSEVACQSACDQENSL